MLVPVWYQSDTSSATASTSLVPVWYQFRLCQCQSGTSLVPVQILPVPVWYQSGTSLQLAQSQKGGTRIKWGLPPRQRIKLVEICLASNFYPDPTKTRDFPAELVPICDGHRVCPEYLLLPREISTDIAE